MASPLFNGPMGKLFQIVNAVQQVRQNPNQLGQLLRDHGRITDEQLNEINQLGGNPSQIGNYLMSHNLMSQQDATQLYQNDYQQVKQAIK